MNIFQRKGPKPHSHRAPKRMERIPVPIGMPGLGSHMYVETDEPGPATSMTLAAADPDATMHFAAVAPDETPAVRPLPARTPSGFTAPPPEPLTADQVDILHRVADGLRTLPAGEHVPVAFLRAIVGGRTELTEPIGRSPVFAGSDITDDGQPVAGLYLGTNEDGWFVLDSTDPAWCEDAITALTAMRDALLQAREGTEAA
jgi:hypothetical protein